MRWDYLCFVNSYEKNVAVLWDSGQLLGSHFGAVAHSCCSGQSRIEQKSSDIPKIIPQFLQLWR